MPVSISCVDAFADRPFSGNPAAVCLLDSPKDESWMQQVAAEMNLAETAFVTRGAAGFDLRWFTPKVEVDLCGHATLAAAHALWAGGQAPRGSAIEFHTRSGILRARRRGDLIELDFPSEPATEGNTPAGLGEALGARILWAGRNRMDYLVEVESEQVLRALDPDIQAIARLGMRGVIVTCQGGATPYDFLSRFFAPAAGIAEDPVTGSAHCALAPFWSARLQRDSMAGYQASARGGVVRVTLRGDRVLLAGRAVTIYEGALLV
jgi:PhzF family phenazine biosynthesis protein